MDITDKELAEKFALFQQEQDATLVHAALDIIEAAERDLPAGDTTARRRAVARWLRFLAALERISDPKWNAQDSPVRGAPPPPQPHGVVYPSGEVDPATIPDPSVRAEYEQALKASQNYDKWYHAQLQLRRIDERAMRFVERLLVERYTHAQADRQEFEDLLASSPVDDARRERLRSLMP